MIDPLEINLDLAAVDTTYPILKEGEYDLQVVESAPKPNKDQSGYNWNLKLVTTSPATAEDGREIAPNFPLFTVVAMQAAKDAADPQGFMKGIASTLDAIFGTDQTTRPKFNKETWEAAVGKTVRATVYKDEYPKGSGNFSNKIRRMKAVTA